MKPPTSTGDEGKDKEALARYETRNEIYRNGLTKRKMRIGSRKRSSPLRRTHGLLVSGAILIGTSVY